MLLAALSWPLLGAQGTLEECVVAWKALEATLPYQPVAGTLQQNLTRPSERVFFIARGRAGVELYRHIPADPNNAPFVRKRYAYPHKLELEEKAFRTLAEVTAGANDTFRIQEILRVTRDYIDLSDVRGRPFLDVLSDDKLAPLKEPLLRAYEQKTASLEQHIKAKYPKAYITHSTFEGYPSMKAVILREQNEMVTLAVNVTQCIVEFDPQNHERFELHLVDPY